MTRIKIIEIPIGPHEQAPEHRAGLQARLCKTFDEWRAKGGDPGPSATPRIPITRDRIFYIQPQMRIDPTGQRVMSIGFEILWE